MPTSSRLADRATTLLALHQPANPVMVPTVWDAWSAWTGHPEKTSRFRPGPLGVGRISVGPFLQTALGTRAKETLARWG
jgi:hypothetical protein